MQLVVPIGYGVWVWCDLTLSIKLLNVRSWRSDANTVLLEIDSGGSRCGPVASRCGPVGSGWVRWGI